jgi:hypothetical protein
LTPQRTRNPGLIGRLKAVVQQAESVQFQQPLTFLNIALAAGYVLGVLGIHQVNFQPLLFQYFEHRHPVNTRRLHGHAAHALSTSHAAISRVPALRRGDKTACIRQSSGRTAG